MLKFIQIQDDFEFFIGYLFVRYLWWLLNFQVIKNIFFLRDIFLFNVKN